MSEIYKVLTVGLDFAGKTSILKILEGAFSDLDQIKPTLGSERTEWEILGFKVMNWDLGGQKQFRDEYLANKEKFLRDTNLVIFVVDVQDDKRFKETASYFNDILQALETLKIRCPVLLSIHKMDPDIADNPEIQDNLKKVTDLFSEYSQEHNVDISVFVTSIFDQKSILELFSEGIQQLMPVGVLSQILDEFVQESKELGVIGTILFDLNYFMIGDSFPELAIKNTCYKSINAFITLMRDFRGVYEENRQINFNLPISADETYKFTIQKLTELTSPYYLLIMGTSSLKVNMAFSQFQKKYVPKVDHSLHALIKSQKS